MTFTTLQRVSTENISIFGSHGLDIYCRWWVALQIAPPCKVTEISLAAFLAQEFCCPIRTGSALKRCKMRYLILKRALCRVSASLNCRICTSEPSPTYFRAPAYRHASCSGDYSQKGDWHARRYMIRALPTFSKFVTT